MWISITSKCFIPSKNMWYAIKQWLHNILYKSSRIKAQLIRENPESLVGGISVSYENWNGWEESWRRDNKLTKINKD